MKLLVTGSTGAVGAEVIRQGVLDERISQIVALSRRPLTIEHPKLRVILQRDFLDYAALTEELAAVDACLFALGISQFQEPDPQKYTAITHDYALACARALRNANPRARFLFVSGAGADANRTRLLWARVKGETENDLRALLGPALTVFRPGYIYPVHGRETTPLAERLSRPLILLRPLLPSLVTDTVEVARALLQTAFENVPREMLHNRDIRAAAARYRTSR